ncbi:hypothetical protein, partial [Bradyrhizobium sp.]|uniref:hypothetical protein n=1 Tax=Bradyrhizobium sp. TaxID=376 RepID=UPI003C6ECA6D
MFRIGFAASLALFAGHLIEDSAFDVTALAAALGCLAMSGCAGILADLRAARAEQEVADRLRALVQA